MLQWTWDHPDLFEVITLFPMDVYPEAVLLDLIVVLVLISWGNFILLSTVTVIVSTTINCAQGFSLLTSSLAFVISCFLNESHSNRCKVISHCGLGLHLPDDVTLSTFSCTCWSFVFGKNVYLSPLSIFNWLICFLLLSSMSASYILDISLISNTWFVKFLPFHRLPFQFLMVSFAVQKLFSLM